MIPAFRRGLLGCVLAAALSAACTPETDGSGGLDPPASGSLVVTVEGLPPGAGASVAVSSAQGYQRNVAGTETLSNLPLGSYAVAALEVVIDGDRYVPAPASQTVAVTPGTAVAVHVAYVLVTARLQLTLEGIPAGGSVTLQLNGPGGYSHSLAGSELLTGLTPGTYQLQTPAVSFNGDQYQALPELRDIVIAAPGSAPVVATVSYALASGRLVVAVSGVPAGANAAIQVTGPGFDRLLTRTDTLTGLLPGSYTLSASALSAGGNSYAPAPASVSVVVSASLIPAAAQVDYLLASGALQVTAGGIPAGSNANITVSGPNGFSQPLSGSQLLTNLAPGNYTVAAGSVLSGGQLYVPAPAQQSILVSAALTPELVAVSYSQALGSLTVTVSGLPAGTSASITVSGPGGYAMALSGSQTVTGLVAGLYSIASGAVSSGGVSYSAQPAVQSVTLSAGGNAAANVVYAATSGTLVVGIS
ncbi:MAG TPA: hypothetical protein VGP61_12405, partial [Gemmatimonadales bacterium]|nr:hypothetical protein [Gemmatimonadales bacterium]